MYMIMDRYPVLSNQLNIAPNPYFLAFWAFFYKSRSGVIT